MTETFNFVDQSFDINYGSKTDIGPTSNTSFLNDTSCNQFSLSLNGINLSNRQSGDFTFSCSWSYDSEKYGGYVSLGKQYLYYSFDGETWVNMFQISSMSSANSYVIGNIPEDCTTLYICGRGSCIMRANTQTGLCYTFNSYTFTDIKLQYEEEIVRESDESNVIVKDDVAIKYSDMGYNTVFSKTFSSISLENSFWLASGYETTEGTIYDSGGITSELGSLSGSSSSTSTQGVTTSTTTSYTYSGTVSENASYNDVNETTTSSISYNVNVSYKYKMNLDKPLDYGNLYCFDFSLASITDIRDLPSGAFASVLSREGYLLVQGEKYYIDSGLSVDFLKHQTNASSVEFVYNVSYMVTTDNVNNVVYAVDNYVLGVTLNQPCLKVYSYGAYVADKELNDSINSGNDLQEESNGLQQEGNQLQQEQNETTNNIFSSITDFFGSFFENLIGIFVPEDGYFEEFFGRLNDFFSEKLGMLYTPIDMFIEILNAIENSSGGSSGLVFPEVKYQEYVIIERQTIDLKSIAGQFDGLQDAIYLGTDILMIGGVLGLLQDKLKEVLKE